VSRTTYVLLPPSQSKEPGGRLTAPPGFFDDALESPRAQVRRALAALLAHGSPEQISRVLKVRGPLLERALDASRAIVEGSAPVLPAWRRFNGVVWSHLDPASLSQYQRHRILVPSAPYGISSATDAIADFRLTMNVGLGDLGNIALFWRPTVTDALNSLGNSRFVNFLPKEHSSAIGAGGSVVKRMVTVTFLGHDGLGVVGHDAKAVKGVLARLVLSHGVDTIDGFDWNGWRGTIRQGEYLIIAPPKTTL